MPLWSLADVGVKQGRTVVSMIYLGKDIIEYVYKDVQKLDEATVNNSTLIVPNFFLNV